MDRWLNRRVNKRRTVPVVRELEVQSMTTEWLIRGHNKELENVILRHQLEVNCNVLVRVMNNWKDEKEYIRYTHKLVVLVCKCICTVL